MDEFKTSSYKRLRKKSSTTTTSSAMNNYKDTSYKLSAGAIIFFFFLHALGIFEILQNLPTIDTTDHRLFLRSQTGLSRSLILESLLAHGPKNSNNESIHHDSIIRVMEENQNGEQVVRIPARDIVSNAESYYQEEEEEEEEETEEENEEEEEEQDQAGEETIYEHDVDPNIYKVEGEARKDLYPRVQDIPVKPKFTPVSVVPKAIWPVSIRNEDGTFEEVIHPGDLTTIMPVPRFWSKPLHDNELMSRQKALLIGSCSVPDHKGNFQRGDTCPIESRTIFVAIASYRDWQCRYTVESIFSRATYPKRLRVAVVDQIVDGDFRCGDPIVPCKDDPNQALCRYQDQVDVFRVDAELAVGPVFARHLGHRLYRGEYYAMQVDAHVSFTQDWDVDIIQQLESTMNEMAVLSTYLTDVVGSIDERTGRSLRDTRPIMCNTDYEGGPQGMHLRHLSQPESYPSINGTPQLQPYWAAGFSFSRGHFVVNVPYDWYLPMIFQGEEISIAVRGFTVGYDYYAPERSVCFHHYAEGKNKAKRNTVNHFWENADRYQGKGKLAMKRLLGILYMNPEIDRQSWDHTEDDIYGIGHARNVQKFYKIFGINVYDKTVVRSLCEFVEPGAMHKMFSMELRSDGMGIDYDKIKYELKR